ncbi:MAG: TrmH family RNA methyltransferase [Muribaculaceae bacterium]
MQQVSNAIRKTVRSLAEAKHRRATGLFVAEGTKCILDTIGTFRTAMLIATPQWIAEHGTQGLSDYVLYEASRADLERMSTLSTPPQVIAVYNIPEADTLPDPSIELVVALDRVQDPGNLGTIIRVCDWMGVHSILASADTVDVWNPKVIQATMGSISRVRVIYTDLPETLSDARSKGVPVYGTFLDGADLYGTALSGNGIIVMGNEGRGIGDACAASVSHRLYIPPYPADSDTAESLNVSVATAIILAEFRRRTR